MLGVALFHVKVKQKRKPYWIVNFFEFALSMFRTLHTMCGLFFCLLRATLKFVFTELNFHMADSKTVTRTTNRKRDQIYLAFFDWIAHGLWISAVQWRLIDEFEKSLRLIDYFNVAGMLALPMPSVNSPTRQYPIDWYVNWFTSAIWCAENASGEHWTFSNFQLNASASIVFHPKLIGKS